MFSFGRSSSERLATCHPDLQKIFNEVILYRDCSILCGHRSKIAQMEAFESGKSKVKWPNSKHNSSPSMAVDVAPYPIDWNDLGRFIEFKGYVFAIADRLYSEGFIDHKLRSGGDWDMDLSTTDNTFNDLPHFELITPDGGQDTP